MSGEERVADRAARELLAADRAETQARIASLSRDLDSVVAAATGSNLDDEHDPEGSTIAFEREQLAALRTQAQDHLAEVDAALGRLDAGSYGQCQRCGQAIAAERLAALPAVRWCVTCAARRPR